MKRLISIALLVACSSGPGDTDPAERPQCEELRDHVVELRLADATGIDVTPHRKALAQSLGEPFITDCTSTMTVAQARCAIAASSLDAATACSGGGRAR